MLIAYLWPLREQFPWSGWAGLPTAGLGISGSNLEEEGRLPGSLRLKVRGKMGQSLATGGRHKEIFLGADLKMFIG